MRLSVRQVKGVMTLNQLIRDVCEKDKDLGAAYFYHLTRRRWEHAAHVG